MKKLIMIFILGMFLISFVSAMEWDNVKSYDKKTRIITIRNLLGFGKDLTKVRLIDNSWKCGEKCFAEGEIELYEPKKIHLYFKELKNGKWIRSNFNNYKFYISDYNTTEYMDDYIYVCNDKTYRNGTTTKICDYQYNGKVPKINYHWKEYEFSQKMPSGKYRWKLEGIKEREQTLDWVINIYGRDLTEWATWETNDLGGDLVSYWKMDETSGDMIDELNNFDGTIDDVVRGTAGIINTAYTFELNDRVIISDTFPKRDNATFSFWINRTIVNLDVKVIGVYASSGFKGWLLNGESGLLTLEQYTGTGSIKCKINYTEHLPLNQWEMITYVWNTTHVIGYVNETKICEIGGTLDMTQTSNFTLGSQTNGEGFALDEVAFWNRTLSQSEIADRYNNGSGFPYEINLSVVLNSPDDDYISTTTQEILFNCSGKTGTGGGTLVNMSLWTNETGNWEPRNSTTGLSSTSYTATWNRTFNEGTILWSCQACNSLGNCSFPANENRTLVIDTQRPNITIHFPKNEVPILTPNKSLNLNFTISSISLDSCWYNYNEINTTIADCNQNTTFIYISGINNLTLYANDTFGRETSEFSSWTANMFVEKEWHSSSTYETSLETFTIQITANSSLTAVNLNYNGTQYPMTQSGSNWTTTITIPLGTENRSFNYILTYAGSDYNSLNYYQNVNSFVLGICNNTLSIPYINFTFKDEVTLNNINATFLTDWDYYLGSGTINKTLSYQNTSENSNYSFCLSPSDKSVNVVGTHTYSASSYEQRSEIINTALTNSTLNKVLYLLSSVDGIYVTFQVLDTSNNVLQGVDVTVNRTISGNNIEVTSGTTDAAGLVTFWLNPDVSHTFVFSKSGYVTYTTSIFPTQSSYTITMGGTAVSQSSDYSKGISITIKPLGDYINNNTTYNFNFTIDSTFYSLEKFNFTLKYGNGTIIGSQQSISSTGGTIGINADTSNQITIIMDYFYIVNSTKVNSTKIWKIESGSSYSIKHFFTRFNTYISANLFGIMGDGSDNFGRVLISVLILMITTGILVSRYGVNSEAAIMGVIFGLILALNSLDFIPNPEWWKVGTLGNFIVFVTFILLISIVIREETR